MTSNDACLLELLERLLPVDGWPEVQGWRSRRQIYTLPAVVWLMVFQRLSQPGTQQQAVDEVVRGLPARLLADCKRVREGRFSGDTGAYSQACGRIPVAVMEKVTDDVLKRLRDHVDPEPEISRPVVVLDGTTLTVEHEAEMLEAFPACKNQYGQGHWGVLHLVVVHDLRTGIPLHPAWGPMYGPERVSEFQLAERVMGQLAPGTVVIGDRNFGIFATAYAADQRQLKVVWRLTKQRACALAKRRLRPGADLEVCWQPSRKDRAKHPELPVEAAIQGRLLVVPPAGFREPLYLFTTLDEPAEAIARLYARRWDLEVDLRSLKRTLRLHHLRAKSKAMAEKELLAAVIAYGLVRAFMAAAASRAGLSPRELSFTRCYLLLNALIGDLCANSADKRQQALDRILTYMGKAKLPRRQQPRSYPREVWGFRQAFPARRPLIK